MHFIHTLLERYANWMEQKPTQAWLAHVGIYLLVSAGIIVLGMSLTG